jgi:phage gp46-like protein
MDLALSYNPTLDAFDISLDVLKADLTADESLTTAVVLSLLTDRTALASDVPAGGDRRGWWADTFSDDSDQFGSRLWLLAREKQLTQTIMRARAFVAEALQWLIDDGLASAVDVAVFAPKVGWMVAQVDIALVAGSRRYRFEWADTSQQWQLASEVH